MKYLGHVPTEQFGFISVEVEGTPEEAVLAYKELKRVYEGGEGIGIRTLSQLAVELVRTGGVNGGGNYALSANESLLLKEITKVLRDERK